MNNNTYHVQIENTSCLHSRLHPEVFEPYFKLSVQYELEEHYVPEEVVYENYNFIMNDL